MSASQTGTRGNLMGTYGAFDALTLFARQTFEVGDYLLNW